MCSAFRKQKIVDDNSHDDEDVPSQSGSETRYPNLQPIREQELARGQKPKSSSSPPKTIYLQLAKPLYCSSNQLWHLCFGHVSSTTLHKLLYIKSSHNLTRCIICIQAKQTRKLFQTSVSKVSHILERIHSDICGPFPTSKSLMKLLLTFLDEYSHWCWITTIDHKSSATVNREFCRLVKQIEIETELKIKYLRTDGSGEYKCDFTPVLEEMGIQYEPMAPYSPQSNGKAERLNHTLKTNARTMFYQANLPKSF